MPGQALTGKRQSMPKVTNVKADDNKKIIFKNMGNNHAYPMFWADTISMDGTSVVVADGVVFHGNKLAENGNIVATPRSVVAANYAVVRDTVNNIVTIEADAAVTADFDVQIILAGNSNERYIEDYMRR
jgi:hypothetical protein